MKSVMYHYVRKANSDLPHFIYLHVDDFEKQIDYFCENYHVVSKKEFDECLEKKETIENGIVLTFDDGLIDHYRYVYPILKKRGLWGVFYIPTKPYEEKVLLDVHRVHYLLGKYGGEKILDLLKSILTDEDLIEGNEELFISSTYTKQDNDTYTTQVKQIVNYYMKPEKKSEVLKKILDLLHENEEILFETYYINKGQVNDMIDNGMSIGSHGHSHTLFSNMNFNEQEQEIKKSIKIIQSMTNHRMYNSFCYPYGGQQSYDKNTLKILEQQNFECAISVESRDILVEDIENKYEIPRYDCNEFQYGKATKGQK